MNKTWENSAISEIKKVIMELSYITTDSELSVLVARKILDIARQLV